MLYRALFRTPHLAFAVRTKSSYVAVVRCFFDRFQLGKPKSQGTAKLATQNDLGAKMYLVRHMTFDKKKRSFNTSYFTQAILIFIQSLLVTYTESSETQGQLVGTTGSCCKFSPMKIPSFRLAAPGSPRMHILSPDFQTYFFTYGLSYA